MRCLSIKQSLIAKTKIKTGDKTMLKFTNYKQTSDISQNSRELHTEPDRQNKPKKQKIKKEPNTQMKGEKKCTSESL